MVNDRSNSFEQEMPKPATTENSGMTKENVLNVAHLARLSLNEEETRQTTEKLASIMTLIDEMQTVNTDGVETLAHPLEAVQRLRADEVTELNQRDKLQANAPASEDGLFLVPRVIE